jgi:membrane-associated phospholipid phosphatase
LNRGFTNATHVDIKESPLHKKYFGQTGCNGYGQTSVKSSGHVMNKPLNPQLIIVSSIVALFLILFSIHFLDARIALYINQVLHSNPFLEKSFRNIPNLLTITVITGTAAMWIIFFRVRHRGSSHHAGFLKLAAIAVPTAFLLKMLLQYIFGRTNIHTWLSNGGPIAFTWFTPLSRNPCFPSGHMTVFTSFFVAVYLYYPRCRPIVALALIGLASALVFTNYHFLGDVIAGFFCGILVTAAVGRFLSDAQKVIIHTESVD